jgi:radical SAM protein with 4Fe4S-binding SPASM domain
MYKIIPISAASPVVDHRHMELIIKPTEKCNFKCTFCSSTNITDDKDKTLDLAQIFRFLEKYPNTGTIIVNGGDPLMVPISYYWDILKYIEDHQLKTTLSLTTNLWAFKVKPEKWEGLFRHERVGVSTSFNYGDTRRITDTEIFTEDIFWEVSDLFLERVGYRPDFISVINDANEDTAIDNVRLAQRMDVECKLNYAMASGEQSTPYQLSKIYRLYTQIYDEGLWPWEYNTKVMMKRLSGIASSCPQNRSCDSGIRCLQPSGDYYSCGSLGDDREFPINFEQEMLGAVILPLQRELELVSMKSECFTCPMFDICNGCKKTIRDTKRAGMVEDHCSLMKTIAGKIIQINETNNNTILDLLPKTGERRYESCSDSITR